jgi:hypothetical protein
MTQPGVPDSADWQRRWTIDAGGVALLPVTRRMAQDVLDGGPVTRRFEEGALHDRIPQAMGVAIRDIDSGAAAALPTVWLVVRRADGRQRRTSPERSCTSTAAGPRNHRSGMGASMSS